MLAFYWVLFVIVSLSRRPKSETDTNLYFILSVANTIGFLSLSAWQIWDFHGGYLYYLAAPATVAYIVVAYLDRAFGQRNLFLLNASIAVVLFAITPELAARDLGFSRDWLAPYWAVGAGLTLLAGYYAREFLLRLESYLLCVPVIFGAWAFNLSGPLIEQPMALWLVVPLIIAFFQLVKPRRSRRLCPFHADRRAVARGWSVNGTASCTRSTSWTIATFGAGNDIDRCRPSPWR